MFNKYHRTLINQHNANFPKRFKNQIQTHRSWSNNIVKASSEKCKDLSILSKKFPRLREAYVKAQKAHELLVKNTKTSLTSHRLKKSKNIVRTSWQIVNEQINNKFVTPSQITLVTDNGEKVEDPTKVANIFRNHFSNNHIPLLNKEPVIIHTKVYPKFEFKTVNPEMVERKIRLCCNKKSAGYDEIPSNLLKQCADIISIPLALVFNQSVEEAVFPKNLKHSIVIPLHKKGDKTDVKNSRPVSLQCSQSKIIECLYIDQLNEHITEFKIISKCQFGYQKNKSTQHALFNMLNSIYGNVNDHLKTIGLFYDQKDAFGLLEFSIMEAKFKSYGITGKALKLLLSFAEGRDFVVLVRNTEPAFGRHEHLSRPVAVTRGTPQGTAMGPQNFILVNNDVRDALPEGELCVYADDTSHLLSDRSRNYDNITRMCNVQASNMLSYCTNNSFMLNLTKTVYMIFHTVQSKYVPKTLDIAINGQALQRATSMVFLGLTITENLAWEPHINKVSSKINSACFLLKKLSDSCPKAILLSVYYAHLQSHVSHGLIFWGFSSHTHRVLLAQKRAIRILCKKHHLESCKPLFIKENILTVYGLLIVEACCMVVRNPDLFTKNNAVHDHATRSSNQVHVEGANLKLATMGPHFACTRVYNHLEPLLSAYTTPKNIRYTLKKIFCRFPFYSLSEFFATKCKEFIQVHEIILMENVQKSNGS
jgi:hypothetical protein